MISECDMTNTKYDREVEGAHVISRSAVGRHTCVLYADEPKHPNNLLIDIYI